MVGAGTFINTIVKLVTTVVILGAVYLFLVKPVLDTTNDAFEQFTPDGFSKTFENLPGDIQDQLDSAFDDNSKTQATKLGSCVTSAGQNTARIQRCVERFGG